MIKETEEEGKAVIEVLSPSGEDKTYETLGLSNKKGSLLAETTPTKVWIEPRIEIDVKSGEEIENKEIKILEDELIKTKLEPKVSTNDNDIDDKDMTSKKYMDPYDKIQKKWWSIQQWG